MRKFYEGYAAPARMNVRYFLTWTCPSCGSADVNIDPDDQRTLTWCDGGPSTEDHMRFWRCSECGARTLGYDMNTVRESIELSPEEELHERHRQDRALSELETILSALDNKPAEANE